MPIKNRQQLLIIVAGAALLGFLAGEMLLTDPAVIERFGESHLAANIAGAIGAAIVVAVGMFLQRRQRLARGA